MPFVRPLTRSLTVLLQQLPVALISSCVCLWLVTRTSNVHCKKLREKIAKIEMSSEVQFSYFHTDDSAPPPS